MSYLFPRRVLRAQDVLDPIELTQDISPAAERLSGRLNAHNFSETISSTVGVDPEAFYAVEHYEYDAPFNWTGVNPNWGLPDSLWDPGIAFRVQNNFEWNVILEPNSTPAQVTISTGNSVLWVNAYAQYLWFGFDPAGSATWAPSARDQHINGSMTEPANMQFAIRLDGNVLPDTITGIDDMTYRSSVPLKPERQRTGTSILPGPADIRGEQVVALGPPTLPVRVTAAIPVASGDHTIELVVRRVPTINAENIRPYKSSDKVFVFGRQVNVIDLKSFPIDSVAGAEVSAPAWDEEELVTTTEIYGQRVQPIISGYNAVKAGNVQRGAFMHYHLPSALLGSYTTEVVFAGERFNNTMPGQSSSLVTATRYAGAPANGWTLVSDGGAAPGGPLLVSNIPSTVQQKLLVLANVQVRNVQGGTYASTASRAASIRAFALFRLMWRRTGTVNWTSLPETDGMVNNFVWWPCDPSTNPAIADRANRAPMQAYGLEQVEVPLMAMIDVPPGFSVNIGVFCGTSGNTDSADIEFEIRHGSIIVLALRA